MLDLTKGSKNHKKKNLSLEVVIKDITEPPPSLKEFNQMLKFHEGNLKKLLNTSSMQYREMQLSQKLQTMTTEEDLYIKNSKLTLNTITGSFCKSDFKIF